LKEFWTGIIQKVQSHFKEGYYGTYQLEVSGDEIMRASPSK
jgi:hypothetical protein